MKRGLIALALGGLAIGMAEFTMMGILPDIAKVMDKEIPVTAHLIALYALGVFVGAPTLVLLTGRFNSKAVLVFLMGLFVVFHSLFSIVPSFETMEITRFMAGLPHGAFFGVGSVVAAKMAPNGKEARYISIMFTGMTIANLLGVPLGTYIGHHFSWRYTYGIIALIGLLTVLSLWGWLPSTKTDNNEKIVSQLRYFKTREAWYLIAIVSIGTGGLFAWLSYIAPLVENVSALSSDKVPIIMTLVGFGMFFGNLLGGKLADTISPTKSLMTSLIAMATCLVLVYVVSPVSWAAYPMAFFTGLVAFTIGPAIQILLIRTAHGSETLAASGGQASFNLGNTLGAYLGGIPITLGFAYNTPVLVGAALAVFGFVITAVFYVQVVLKKYRPSGHKS